MTPKEKAEELFEMFDEYAESRISQNGKGFDKTYCKKQCALIAVDEILNNFGTLTEGKQHYAAHCTIKFYEEVKQEILTYGGNK